MSNGQLIRMRNYVLAAPDIYSKIVEFPEANLVVLRWSGKLPRKYENNNNEKKVELIQINVIFVHGI